MFCGGDVMIEFPKSTFYNIRVPKQKFYSKLSIAGNLEKLFIREIDSIIWKYKLSSDTLNISIGTYVTEIQIFEIILKEQNLSQSIIEFIDREIPYHLVFILKYKDLGQLCISFKEQSKNRQGKFKVDSIYKSPWMNYDELSLEIDGLDLDKVYENFLIQISGGNLEIKENSNVKEAVEKSKEKEKLHAYIKKLENRIKNEKQFNRQVKMMGELRTAKKQLENS
jgi:hypothetical protein